MSETFFDFSMPWNGLRHFAFGILIPVMVCAMPEKDAAFSFDDPDEVDALHFSTSSPTFRTPGMLPLVSSW